MFSSWVQQNGLNLYVEMNEIIASNYHEKYYNSKHYGNNESMASNLNWRDFKKIFARISFRIWSSIETLSPRMLKAIPRSSSKMNCSGSFPDCKSLTPEPWCSGWFNSKVPQLSHRACWRTSLPCNLV